MIISFSSEPHFYKEEGIIPSMCVFKDETTLVNSVEYYSPGE